MIGDLISEQIDAIDDGVMMRIHRGVGLSCDAAGLATIRPVDTSLPIVVAIPWIGGLWQNIAGADVLFAFDNTGTAWLLGARSAAGPASSSVALGEPLIAAINAALATIVAAYNSHTHAISGSPPVAVVTAMQAATPAIPVLGNASATIKVQI